MAPPPAYILKLMTLSFLVSVSHLYRTALTYTIQALQDNETFEKKSACHLPGVVF